MKTKLFRGSFIFCCTLIYAIILQSGTAYTKENPGGKKTTLSSAQKSASNCPNPTTQTDLDVNNVRATILGGSDMWWNLVNPVYEIPKGSNKHSLYSGALWIGGLDNGQQIKTAAQTYRQTGNDFWMGPMDTVNINTTSAVCNAYDKHFETTRADVIKYVNDPSSVSQNVTTAIKNWPGNGNASLNQGNYLAPFYDANGNGLYEPDNGDYPHYNLSGNYPVVPGYGTPMCNDYLFGDKNLWWVFNDVGNVHSESSGDQIGLEIRAQAFAFNTNDEINNMTFYKYQIINRGFTTLDSTYFGQWVDPDLGNAVDDYVGCDVNRGLGFVYNGDADDDGSTAYGLNPPACGVDFFQGPQADLDDGKDNDRDGCIDCTFIDSAGSVVIVPDEIIPELIIMSKFVYYDNNGTTGGNPNGFTDFYNYLRGNWLNNIPITYGENGANPSNPICDFMFPGSTDGAFFPTLGEWTEVTAGNLPGDRRFIQSAGPFTLLPGAVNYITTGVVWARANAGGPLASVELMKLADDKAQALFDNCFKLLDGPDAPTVEIRELDKQLIFSLMNTDTTTVELYDAIDPTIVGYPDSLRSYRFQGYKIYQVRDHLVNVADLDNPDRARLVMQMDIKDGVSKLVNYTFDPSLGGNVPALKVDGSDQGIRHSFRITTDAFASGSTTLVNNKTYYFTAVSYAYNQYKLYDPSDPQMLDGQKKPYLEGRNNIQTYSAIPHNPKTEAGGTYLHSAYGDGPLIQRIDGQGNGGQVLEFTPATENEILNAPDFRSYYPVYTGGHGPVDIKVYDPMLVTKGNYETKFTGVAPDSLWEMKNLTTGLIVQSSRPLKERFEQLYPEWGLSANIYNIPDPGDAAAVNNGFLMADMTFSDNSNQWLTGLQDVDGGSPLNWIRSGNSTQAPVDLGDPGQVYEGLINGTWAPFKLTSADGGGPKWGGPGIETVTKLSNVASVNVVITSDKSKWSRAAVIETDDLGIGIGNALKGDLRKSPSVDKNGVANFPSPDNDDFPTGMGWFPGYAVNLETGERLNITFGENSALPDENGADMIWNPTANIADVSNNAVFGGMHFVYIMGHNGDLATDAPWYDGCAFIHNFLDSAATVNISSLRRNIWKDAIWVTIPLTVASKVKPKPNEMFVPPADVKVRLRVAKGYKPYICKTTTKQNLLPNTSYTVVDGSITYNGITYQPGNVFQTDGSNLKFTTTANGSAVTPPTQNNYMPYYKFSTDGLAADKNNSIARHDALALINVVPNPYYAISGYEGTAGITGQVDNRIRITNLPPQCKISIFTTNGTLIRQFNRQAAADNSKGGIGLDGNTNTSQDWDLKNEKGISVGSGIYLIHITVPGVGEKVVKWFGVMRPVDLDTF